MSNLAIQTLCGALIEGKHTNGHDLYLTEDMDGKMNFLCEHEPECSKPDRYWAFSQYTEIWSTGGLIEIIPDESAPSGFACTECGSQAEIEAEKIERKTNKKKAEQPKLFVFCSQ